MTRNMTTPHNPYQKPPLLSTAASLGEYIDPMEEESPSSSKTLHESTEGSQKTINNQESPKENMIDIKEEDKPLPPSFHQTIMEEFFAMTTTTTSSGPQFGSLSLRILMIQLPQCLITWKDSCTTC